MMVRENVSNERKKIVELTAMNETKRALRGVIDDVEYVNRELLEMYAYALYDIHCIYLGGGSYADIVNLFNSRCAKQILCY